MADVKIYARSSCIHCRRAKAFLESHQIKYEEVDTSTPDGQQELQTLGFNVVPILIINGQTLKGVNEAKVSQALGIA